MLQVGGLMSEQITYHEFDKLKEKYLRNISHDITIIDLFEISELQELQDSNILKITVLPGRTCGDPLSGV